MEPALSAGMKTQSRDVAQPTLTPRRLAVVSALLLTGFLGAGYTLVAGESLMSTATGRLSRPATTIPEAVGTEGETVPAVVAATGRMPTPSPAVIQDVETITGSIDGHELVGRRVEMHVSVQKLANRTAFWAGPADNRILVVLDTAPPRSSRSSKRGNYAEHHVLPVHSGQQATITGTIRRVPDEPRVTWGWPLSEADRRELAERNIYVRAERVTPSGHSTVE